jgi:hypothetical protein|tara:strand:+ start:1152 stop:1400 length:249 start_codon:yes stop_codon:yes gene_type:complete
LIKKLNLIVLRNCHKHKKKINDAALLRRDPMWRDQRWLNRKRRIKIGGTEAPGFDKVVIAMKDNHQRDKRSEEQQNEIKPSL